MNEKIHTLMKLLNDDPIFNQWLELIHEPVMVLDLEMKLVTANRALLQLVNATDGLSLVGQSPLKVINCQFMNGTSTEDSNFTMSLRSPQDLKGYSEECSLITYEGRWLNFRIELKNYNFNGSKLIIMFMHDIANEKYRSSLERIFFNDLNNTASGLYSLLSIVVSTPENTKELMPRLLNLAQGLLDDINSQRDLRLAEQKEIIPERNFFNANELVQELADYLRQSDHADNKNLTVKTSPEPLMLFNDRRLVRQVLNNMLKNACEATPEKGTVSIVISEIEDKVKFSVHNPGVIAPETAKRLFEPFYSTKGKGRGWGTYGMKLLTDRYLDGEINFETSAEEGTTFNAIYPKNA